IISRLSVPICFSALHSTQGTSPCPWLRSFLLLSKMQLINQPWTMNLYLIISIVVLVKKGNLSKIITWMPYHHSLFGCEWLLHLSFGTAKTYSSLYCLRRCDTNGGPIARPPVLYLSIFYVFYMKYTGISKSVPHTSHEAPIFSNAALLLLNRFRRLVKKVFGKVLQSDVIAVKVELAVDGGLRVHMAALAHLRGGRGPHCRQLRRRGSGAGADVKALEALTNPIHPICFDMIEEAYMTNYKCIHQSLEDNNRCPKCNYVVDNIDHLYPNFLVNELILKQKQRFEEKRFKLDHSNGHRWQIFQDLLGTDQDNLDLANVNLMLELLVQKKKQLEAESHAAQLQILMEFLKVARRNKREQLEQIQKELSVLEEDIKRVE
ncbi:hypothetical protein E2I00_012202, partial [Balaenoptera physalus]